ncbi:sensor histidine kinase [Saccharopolyspora sp. CA-218241]|uniref:sensor histidine kinase n=1 Tax=Saccharopolyspora sp. CA-218241 TaxID=3240027 RepID=UPI003D96A704
MKRPLWRLLWNSKREAAFDVALVLGLQVLGRVMLFLFPSDVPAGTYDWAGGTWADALIMHALTLGLLVRRRFPVALMTCVAVLTLVQSVLIELGPGPLLVINRSTDPWMPATAPWTIYAAIRYAQPRRRWIFAWDLVAITSLLAVRPWAEPPGETLVNAVVLTVLPSVLALYARARHRLVDALRERAERAEREQELLAHQARADERTRLAAEMHDVVTHRVSLMVLQAGALGVAAQDPETRRAAGELRASGCEALEELRDLVGVLRSGSAEPAAPAEDAVPEAVPGIGQLVSQSEAVGVPVRLVEDGDPALVSAAVGRTAYRVVQEALTNVHKHAPGAAVTVRTIYSDERVRLFVRNSPPLLDAVPGLAGSGSGTGLLGLQQRVELVGGAFRAGATDEGGFEVDVILPAYVPTGEASADA